MKELELANSSEVAIIDDEDFDRLSGFRWYLQKNKAVYRHYGIKKKNKNWKNTLIFLHQEILQDKYIDHINHNRLDNRKENLRLATTSQNCANRIKYKKNSTSKYKGVTWKKDRNKWRATIKLNGKSIHLGYFASEIEAAQSYNKTAIEFFKEFACINNI